MLPTCPRRTVSLSVAGSPKVGVLALQGDVREHATLLAALGAEVILVRRPEDLAAVNGLVIPGGESSVIDKLSRTFGMQHPIRQAIDSGMPMLGTCAGLILLADTVLDAAPGQQTFGGLDVTVRRNAFGRQAESFEADLSISELGEEPLQVAFIRGPVIESVGSRARVLAALGDGRVVAVEQDNILATSFHPETTGEKRLHERFLERAETWRHTN